jgi:DNA helicase-2/ATP-dependent DNA helicase PcrA
VTPPRGVHFHAMDLSTLNLEQLEAVLHKDGPLLVFAGAGTGKTRVITYRIAHLIREHGVPPRHILAVTFTNKAANEMKERLNRLLEGREARGLWVGTFHAVCARILRESGRAIDIPPNFVVYDDSDQLEVVRRVLIDLNIDEKQIGARPIRNAISRAKERLITPNAYRETASDYFERIVASVYERYETYLRAANALDFDDLINKVIELLETQPHARERYQDQFRYILVDEYQDVNYAQYVLTRLLAEKHRNLCVVGDDDQSIYAFRGAEVELILRFEKDFPDAKVIKLEQNYRSTQVILDAAFKVVSENRFRAPKRLWTERTGGAPITLTPPATRKRRRASSRTTSTARCNGAGDATATSRCYTAPTPSRVRSRSGLCASASRIGWLVRCASTTARRSRMCWRTCACWRTPTTR